MYIRHIRLCCALGLGCWIAVLLLPGVDARAEDSLHAWTGDGTTPVELDAWVHARLAAEEKAIAQLLAVKGRRTVENTLVPFDEAQNQLTLATNETYLLYATGDQAPLRDKAQAMAQAVQAVVTALSLNRPVYEALTSIDRGQIARADAGTGHYLERTLLEYRLAGVDRDDATRSRIRQLADHVTEVALTFGRNVQDDVRKVEATRAEMDGLPEDYIARHKPDARGVYTITTDEPEVFPVLKFAKSEALRRRLWVAYENRAYPKNQQVLLDLLRTRQELASTLGYASYADLATADQMMGSTTKLKGFLDEVEAAARGPQQKEFAAMLSFAQEQQPELKVISDADTRYWAEQYRRSAYAFDSQSVRPYFAYARVEAGVLQTAARLFHVGFRAVSGPTVWDRGVATYDVYEGERKVGRIYLDMHPREGKDKWFSSAPVVPGIRGRQLPEGALICNFGGGKPDDPGLMEYADVVTFFHEFGHLMHHILGGQNQWSGAGGFSVEGDFVEAPSQMLEEFFRDPAILTSFARHYQTGGVMPAALIAQMNRAGAFGRGAQVMGQLVYSTYSLQVHSMDPAKLDLDAVWKQDQERLTPYAHVDGTHFVASFTHLIGYGSNYYTYLLDKVIALDFFAQFDKANLLDGPTMLRYRRSVLEPGASKPAAELVRDFLGRPQSIDALKAWMNVEFEGSAPNAALAGSGGH